MRNRWMGPAAAGLVVAVAACGEPGADEALVARVDGHELTVDQVVDLLVDEEQLAPDANVVRTLAGFWIDYTLLAEAVREDSTFRRLDLEPLVQRQLEQTMVFQLRDSVIQVDTFITEGELQELYETQDPSVELRARHIMLTYPVQATPAQRDSVRALLEDLRESIVAGGASFEASARQYSQDPSTARLGGDLGYFGRGEMVAPFEEAALALETGEVSEVVETPMGLHLIRLDDRRTQGFEQIAPSFRLQVQDRRVQEAESTFVAAIEGRVSPAHTADALPVARELARNPGTTLSRRAARRPLVEWAGGGVTAGELQMILRLEAPQLRDALASAEDDVVEGFLDDLTRRELLIEEARSAGLQPDRERVDSLVADAARQLRNAARSLGLMSLDQAPGEPAELAVARAVEGALADNLAGATQFVPLGIVSFQLRDRASFALVDAGIGQAILRISQVRAGRAPSPAEGAGATGEVTDTLGPAPRP